MTVASAADVEQALMRSIDAADEAPYVEGMLEYVEATILLAIPDALDKAKARKPYETVLKRVEAEAVCRVLRAPAGGVMKYETEGTYTYSVNAAIASGLLELRPAEWAMLRDHPGGWSALQFSGDGYLANRRGDNSGSWSASVAPHSPPDPPPSDLCGVSPWGYW